MKSFLKSGLMSAGASGMDNLILINDYFSLSPHEKLLSFLIIFCSGCTISEKLGTNLLTKFIFPKKDCMDFLVAGKGILEMAYVLSRSIMIPSFDTTNPSKIPSVTANIYFLGFREIPNFLQRSSTFRKCEM